MIIEKIYRIIHEIRLTEAQFEMPPHCNIENDLRASALCHKTQREEAIAKNLYQAVKDYALSNRDTI